MRIDGGRFIEEHAGGLEGLRCVHLFSTSLKLKYRQRDGNPF